MEVTKAFAVILSLVIIFSGTASDGNGNRLVYRCFPNDDMKIALTFDDGPDPKNTLKILEILEKYGIKATFFMVGENVGFYPEIAKEVIKAGHEVGNHTYSHCSVKKTDLASLRKEINKCEEEIYELCECRPKLFRPPEGCIGNNVAKLSSELGFKVILWNIDTLDWAHTDSGKIVKNVLDHVKSGDIILMHDYIVGYSPTLEALEKFIPILLERGYKFVTVSELVALYTE